jgi:hypothetical protein
MVVDVQEPAVLLRSGMVMTGGIGFGEEVCKLGGAQGVWFRLPGRHRVNSLVVNPGIPLFYSARSGGGVPAADAKMGW